MQTYFIDPKAPLIFRTGKPFGQAVDGESMAFPLPSTTAGACRTIIGDTRDADFTDTATRDDLLACTVHGPLAACRTANRISPLYPKPTDAIYLRSPESADARVFKLRPSTFAPGVGCDLPHGLQPVCLENEIRGKPVAGPGWWDEKNMETWLCGRALTGRSDDLGWEGPQRDRRTHVSLQPETWAAADGELFQTEGLDFGPQSKPGQYNSGREETTFGLLVRAEAKFASSWRRLGADGRLVFVRQSDDSWPLIPHRLVGQLKGAGKLRLILATPALFNQGWRPGWLDESLQGAPPQFPGIRLKLRAAAMGRWETVSGWDLATKRQRAARRMVPAGSVFWFDVLEGSDQLDKLWLQPVSDRRQDRCDGYGLVLPAAWEE